MFDTGTSHRPNESASTRRRPTSCWTTRATGRAGRHPPRRPRRQRLDFRLFGRSDSAESQKAVGYIQGWLADIGIAPERHDRLGGQPDRDHRPRRVRPVRVGLGGRARPGLPAVHRSCGSRSTTRTAARQAGLSDSFYCNPDYDALYQQPKATTTDPKPSASTSSSRCRRSSTTTAPYAVTYYYANLEAYRSDRFTSFIPQPDPNGSSCSSTAPDATRSSARRRRARGSDVPVAARGYGSAWPPARLWS